MARVRSQVAGAAPAQLEPGELVDGYRVERVLAVGAGRSIFVQAIAPSGARVALKLLGQAPAGAEARRQALHLAQARASIEHPHLAALLKVGEHNGRLYLISELRGTTTLADRLAHQPIDAADAVRALAGVAGGLESAAREGLVHAELDPQAILFSDRHPSQAFLTDFGIGRERARPQKLRLEVEGLDYRSPEDIKGDALLPESNAYSLACVLYECLTGSPPYPYERPVLTLHAHLVEPPPRPSALRSDLPSELDELFDRALAKDPAERPGCAALVRAAAQALGMEVEIPQSVARPVEKRTSRRSKHAATPVRVKRATAPVRPARPRKSPKRRRLRPVTALVAIGLVASAASGFALGRPELQSAPASTGPAQPQADPTELEQARYARNVSPVIDRLSARRTAARSRLRRARRPDAQAAAAGALVEAYADARRALPAEHEGDDLRAQLRSAERAYRRLAAAARNGNERAWRAASRATVEHERRFERSLSTITSA